MFHRSSPTGPGARRDARGFTLVELMVTLIVFAVVIAAVTMVLIHSSRSKAKTTQVLETSQAARAAVDLMTRDLRSAGYGADLDWAGSPQPAIAYVDSQEIIMGANLAPYPDNTAGPTAPLAYNPASTPKPAPLDGTGYQPPIRYRTGAELVRYTLDVNNDGVVDASDVSSAQGADASSTPNPSDYVLVRQVYGDSTGNVSGSNGGSQERVALVMKPGGGVPAMFNVYFKGSSTAWDWSGGAVPANRLADIQRIEIRVTAGSPRPDAKGAFAKTTLQSEVNAMRSVPNFGATTYNVDGYVFEDKNTNHVLDGSDVGIANVTVRLGTTYTAYTNSAGYFSFKAPAGNFVLKHTPAAGYGSFSAPDTFNLTVGTSSLTRSFADTSRSGGWVTVRTWDDNNQNTIWDTGETAISGIGVALAGTTLYTDSYGSAQLFASPGGFSVSAALPDSYVVTNGNPQTGSMTNGGTASVSFGLKKQLTGKVQGKVFTDANRNGTLDGAETGLANAWVGMTSDNGITVAGWAYTNATGDYSIVVPINDPPRTTPYSVYTIPPAGYFPTSSTAQTGLWVTSGSVTTGRNFGMAGFQVISLSASRVLCLTTTDLVEQDWNGNQTQNARKDKDLVLGADAGGTDNVDVWFNAYASNPLYSTTPNYTRVAPNAVLSIAADTLDKVGSVSQPDIVAGTKYVSSPVSGNFWVWFTQSSNNNEGYLPTNYSPGQGYRTTDNGDVQAVATIDVANGSMPDIIVGTKSPTAGQGTIEVWQSNDATTPTFSQTDRITTFGGSPLGEITSIALVDINNDGRKDLIATAKTSDYNGQLIVWQNVSKNNGNRFVYRYGCSFGGNAPMCVVGGDLDADGYTDLIVGTQRSTSSGMLFNFHNLSATTTWSFAITKVVSTPGIVMSLNAGDFGGGTRTDIAVGMKAVEGGYAGSVRIYYCDVGNLPDNGVDPSSGNIINMVPALTSANFNYGLNTTSPPSPYLTDLAAGVKSSSTTGALVVFIR